MSKKDPYEGHEYEGMSQLQKIDQKYKNKGKSKSKSSSDLQELRKEIDNVNYQLQNLEIGLVFISFVLC